MASTNALPSLGDLKSRLSTCTLHDIMGDGYGSLHDSLSLLFPRQSGFEIVNVADDGSTETQLTFTATFSSLLPWRGQVDAHFALFDLDSGRQVLFYVQPDAAYSAYVYLSQYALKPTDPLPASDDVAPYLPLADWVQTFAFAPDAQAKPVMLLYSTLDYSDPKAAEAPYPPAFAAVMDGAGVRAGLNFPARADLDGDLVAFLASALSGSTPGGQGTCRGLVSARGGSPYFTLAHPFTIPLLSIGGQGDFTVSLTELDLAMPLTTSDGDGDVETVFAGQASIEGAGSLLISADLNPFTRTLTLEFRGFPTLQNIIDLAGGDGMKDFFPLPLDAVLHIDLAMLRIAFAPSAPSLAEAISEIDLTLTAPPIKLVDNWPSSDKPLAIQDATLDLCIRMPFADGRTIEGELAGTWQLGQTKFLTTFTFPNYAFALVKSPDTPLDVDEIFNQILPGGFKKDIKITDLAFQGRLLEKSVSALITVDSGDTWSLDLPGGGNFTLESIGLAVAYENGSVSCELDCQMELKGAKFFVSGGYDSAQGVTISGGTAAGQTIKISDLVNDLLKDLGLPEDFPTGLDLTNILFSATPQAGAFSLSAQSAQPWQLASGVSLSIEQFAIEKNPNEPVGGVVGASLTIDDKTQIRVFAAKKATAGGSWQFRGSAANIPLGKLIAGLSTKLGASDGALPAELEDLVVDALLLEFSSAATTTFNLTCDLQFPVHGTTVYMQLTAAYSGSQGSRTLDFGGYVVIAGQHFMLKFRKTDKAAAGGASSSTLLLAAYENASNVSLDLNALLADIGVDVPELGLTLGIRDALFARASDDKGAIYLFGLTLFGQLSLAANTDLFGDLLGSIALQDLTMYYAAGALTGGYVEMINGGLAGSTVPLLPAPPKPAGNGQGGAAEPPALPDGLSLSATLLLPGNGSVAIVTPRPAPGEEPEDGSGAAQEGGAGRAVAPAAPATAAPAKAATAAPAGGAWFDVQRSLGPIYVDRIGARYTDGRIWFLLAGGLHLGPMKLDLDGLGLGFKPGAWADVSFALAGLSLDYRSDPLALTAAFLQTQMYPLDEKGNPLRDPITIYAGEVRISLPTLSIVGVGAYGKLSGGRTALFLYAALSFAEGEGLGSPPFVVTGLALGFGINYRVDVPPIDKVRSFPLVSMVMDGQAPAATAGSNTATINTLESSGSIEPAAGENFGALGLRFTLFERVDAFALAIVRAGVELEIALLGLGSYREPVEGDALCFIELALLVDIRPSEGVVRIEAQLTTNSWVFDTKCRLTGGFALVVWYGGDHRGDFVLSVGGYHPRFQKPDYYPDVPRLGFNLQMDSLVLKGESYFALTPSIVMAGGRLEAAYSSGRIQATFIAYVDFLMQWKPFHYDIGAGISIHVVADLWLFTIDVSLSVDLAIQGPPFHGVARVHLAAISFDVTFGQASEAPPAIATWNDFAIAFLGGTKETPVPPAHQLRLVSGQVLRPTAAGGQKQPAATMPAAAPAAPAASDLVWRVRGDELALAVASTVPASSLDLRSVSQNQSVRDALATSGLTPLKTFPSGPTLGASPMNASLASPLAVTVVHDDTGASVDDLDQWALEADSSAMPKAVWNTKAPDTSAAPGSDTTLPGCVTGARSLKPPAGVVSDGKVLGITAQAIGHQRMDDRTVSELPATALPAAGGDASALASIVTALAGAAVPI